MASGVYSLEFETICTVCYLPDCCEFAIGLAETPSARPQAKRNICPLRIAKRLKLTAAQGKRLSEIARFRQYRPQLFLKMAEIQAQWNLIPVGGLWSE